MYILFYIEVKLINFISLYNVLFVMQYNLIKLFYDRNANYRNSGFDI